MDINCTNKCAYQIDGKCVLQELPTLISSTYDTGRGCLYSAVCAIGEQK